MTRELKRLSFDEVEPEYLNAGTWRKILLSGERLPGAQSCLGYSNFAAGSITDPIVHEVEEFAFVIQGTGELRGDTADIVFRAFDTLHIPAGCWHSIANTGDEDIVMIFGFPAPQYPATQKRSAG